MNQMVKNNNKDKDNNNSSNSLVFGRWPQTKMKNNEEKRLIFGGIRSAFLWVLNLHLRSCKIFLKSNCIRMQTFFEWARGLDKMVMTNQFSPPLSIMGPTSLDRCRTESFRILGTWEASKRVFTTGTKKLNN